MRHRQLLPLLLIIIFGLLPYGASDLFAQDVASRDTVERDPAWGNSVERNKYNISQFGRETWRYFIQPTKWDGSDWLNVGLTGAGTFLVMQIDQPIRDAVTSDQRYYRTVPF